MKQLIKQADLLVSPFEFNIKEQGAAVSVLGGFSSILIIIFTICYFLGVLIKSLGSLSDIYAGSQSDQDTNSVKYLENTLVAIEISNDKGNILSNLTEISQYINITGQYIQQQRIEEVEGYKRNYTSLNIVNCSKDKVEQFNFDPQAMTQRQQENLICFDGYFNLKGQFYDSYFSFFRIMVQVCNNKTSNNCKSLDEIKSFVNSGIKIDLFIQSARIRLKYNESSPAYLYPNTIYWKLSSQAANNEDIYMETVVLDIKKTKFLNNVFGVSNDERIFQGQVVQKQERRQDSTSIDHNAVLASFYLRQSAEFQYYFMIQQDFIALFFLAISQSTGLFLAILQIAKQIYRIYSDHHTLRTIMNSVYMFNLKSKSQKKAQSNIINEQILTQKLEEVMDYKIKFSFYENLKYEMKRIFRKIKLYKEKKTPQSDYEKEITISLIAKKKIQRDLDLSNILQKLYEIDCLKLLLLDDKQLLLFNAICKPLFTDTIEEQIEESQKLVSDVETQITNDLQMNHKLKISQTQEEKNFVIQQSLNSTIPIEFRLANLAWFFKSQLKLTNRVLVQNFITIKEQVENSKKKKENDQINYCEKNQINEKLIKFTQQNGELNKVLEQFNSILKIDNKQREYNKQPANNFINSYNQQEICIEISPDQNQFINDSDEQNNHFGNDQQQNNQIP